MCGLIFGTIGVTEGVSAAKTPKAKTFKAKGTFTTHSIGPDGSFSAPIAALGKGADLADTVLSGVVTQGPGKKTKTKVKGTATVDAQGHFTMDVNGPWQQSTLNGTVRPPTGFGEPTAMKVIDVSCVCDWTGLSWTWTITLSFKSASTA